MLHTPRTDELAGIITTLGSWQADQEPMQLHPGDVGWFETSGAAATAAALRVWCRGERMLAVGLLDGPELLRLAIAPEARQDAELADAMAADITRAERGVLPAGEVAVEAPRGAAVREQLARQGWALGEPWTQLRCDLTKPVPDPGLRVEQLGTDAADPQRVADRTAVHRSAFDSPRFTPDLWVAMASGGAYDDARCLVGYDDSGTPVAAVTVWSAGPGSPGLLEPMGVHADHRGRGHGRAITLAAAAALREMGAASANVCTPSSNTAAVATYVSAGFRKGAEVPDLCRHP